MYGCSKYRLLGRRIAWRKGKCGSVLRKEIYTICDTQNFRAIYKKNVLLVFLRFQYQLLSSTMQLRIKRDLNMYEVKFHTQHSHAVNLENTSGGKEMKKKLLVN